MSRDHPTELIAERTDYRIVPKNINSDINDFTINDAHFIELNNDTSKNNDRYTLSQSNNINNETETVTNKDLPESCDHTRFTIGNSDNDIIVYDANKNNNLNVVTTNLSQLFENVNKANKSGISTNSIGKSSDHSSTNSIGKSSDHMIESCNRSNSDSSDDTNDDGIIPYDELYSKYVDACFTNQNLLDDKVILENNMMKINLENEILKMNERELLSNKNELKKTTLRLNKLKESSKTTSK